MSMQPKAIAYWATTGLLAAGLFTGGVAELIRRSETIEGMVHLGYPVYFVMILGFWKVLGSIVLLVPRLPRLKEWAYAGIVFNMTGAFVSHLVRGSGSEHLVAAAFFVALTVASWALRPESRVLGEIAPARDWRRLPVAGSSMEPSR